MSTETADQDELDLPHKLPEKLSDLLELALNDLASVEADPLYLVEMNMWHQPLIRVTPDDPACGVCLAGSVLARTLEVPIDVISDGREQSDYDNRRLDALDYLRVGNVPEAIDVAGLRWSTGRDRVKGRYVTPYHQNRAVWWRDMRTILDDLRTANL